MIKEIDFARLTTREINANSKRLADTAFRAYRNAKMLERNVLIEIEEARRAPIEDVKQAFADLKMKGQIPKSARFAPFRIAWRGPYTITHGTISGYNQGCRYDCTARPTCSQVWTIYQRDRYQRKKAEKAAAKAKRAMQPFEEAAAINEAKGVPALATPDDQHDRWAGMNAFIRNYPDNTIIPVKVLNSSYEICGISSRAERMEWLMQADVEYRADGEMYKKESK